MPGVVAVGFFDGVHLGHRRILEGADAALTFRNHPSSVLRPESAKTLLMPYSEKEEFIRACGVKNVIALDFTPELASMPPEKFIDFIASFSKVRCGADWRFGKGAKGDAEFLRGRGFEVEVVPYAELDGERISSTRIRAALEKGDLKLFARSVNNYWRDKKLLDPGSTNERVDEIIERISSWTDAVTLTGAGGGGFMYILAKSKADAAKIKTDLERRKPSKYSRFYSFEIDREGLMLGKLRQT
jgi:glycerol-3-phosphate cytidylyltransferase-like family protein